MAKYHYYRMFSQDPAIKRYLPDTAICRRRTLDAYLSKYGTVYIKPDVGGRGEGVTKAWRTPQGLFYIVEKGNPTYCASVDELYDRLSLARKKRHVVQQGLELSEYRGQKYDIRIMMVRDPGRRWQVCGMLAKTAGRGSIITNILRGHGEVINAQEALAQSHPGREAILVSEMVKLVNRCNRVFSKIRYEWQMGYDVGVDVNGKLWLIEANPGNPSHALFRRLKDQSTYWRIKRAVARYKKAYR